MGVPVRYMFALEVENFDIRDDAMVERFCADVAEAYPSSRDGNVKITYVIEADEGKPCDAVLDAANHLRGLLPEVKVKRISLDLVAISDIADRVGRARATVRSWVKGTRGPGGFPNGISVVGGGIQVWHWPEVNEWLRVHHPDLADDERGLLIEQIERINVLLASNTKVKSSPAAGPAVSGQPEWKVSHRTAVHVRRTTGISLPSHPYKSRTVI